MRKITVEKLRGVAALLDQAEDEQVLVTRGGRPVAVVTHVGRWDAEDWSYATDPEFWKLIRGRRKEPTVSFEQTKSEIAVREASRRPARTGGKARTTSRAGKPKMKRGR